MFPNHLACLLSLLTVPTVQLSNQGNIAARVADLATHLAATRRSGSQTLLNSVLSFISVLCWKVLAHSQLSLCVLIRNIPAHIACIKSTVMFYFVTVAAQYAWYLLFLVCRHKLVY